MNVIGLSNDEQNSIFRVLATILWLGNVEFVEGDDGNATIADTGVTDFAAYLMEVDPAQLQKVLLSRIVETTRGGRRGQLSHSGFQAQLMARICLRGTAERCAGIVGSRCVGKGPVSCLLVLQKVKAHRRYNNLFEWIVSRVNVSMKPQSASEYVIGVLDI